jgi:UDP-N-acetylmuramate--alanine ligase
LGKFKISLPGRHNVLNSLAVIVGSLEMGLNIEKVRQNLVNFYGAARRFDVLGEYRGAVVIDDYAHHPSEVKASLQAVSQRYPGRNIITVFHPHTFTRTLALFDDFKKGFKGADELIVIDIYGSARETQGGTSSKELIKAISDWNRENKIKQKVVHQTDLAAVEKYLRTDLKSGDLLLLMGAGDIFRVGEKLLKK